MLFWHLVENCIFVGSLESPQYDDSNVYSKIYCCANQLNCPKKCRICLVLCQCNRILPVWHIWAFSEKPSPWILRPGKVYSSQLSYGDKLEYWIFARSKFNGPALQTANNKGADQTARMGRLVCAFVIRIQQVRFSRRGPSAIFQS